MGSGALGGLKNFIKTPVGGSVDSAGNPTGGVGGTSYGGLLAGGLSGATAKQNQPSAPMASYNAPTMPYVPPPDLSTPRMGQNFYGG